MNPRRIGHYVRSAFAAVMLACGGLANAALIQVSFAGIMHDGYGSSDGLDLTNLYFSPITGSVTFDTSSFLLNADTSSSTLSQWNAPLLSVVQVVAGHTFTFTGSSNSWITLASDNFGMNGFQILAAAENPKFTSVFFGNFDQGATFISDLHDPSTISFSYQGIHNFGSASSIAPGAGFYFEVNSAFSTVINSVPEPSTYAMLLAGLGWMGAVMSRRKQEIKNI